MKIYNFKGYIFFSCTYTLGYQILGCKILSKEDLTLRQAAFVCKSRLVVAYTKIVMPTFHLCNLYHLPFPSFSQKSFFHVVHQVSVPILSSPPSPFTIRMISRTEKELLLQWKTSTASCSLCQSFHS